MAERIGERPGLIVGVFYDPATRVTDTWREDGGVAGCRIGEQAARAQSMDDLRAQVNGFIERLCANGAL